MISMTNQINEATRESINQLVSESFSESDIETDGEYNEEDSAFVQQSLELEIGTGSIWYSSHGYKHTMCCTLLSAVCTAVYSSPLKKPVKK
ncbi:unnamed protein product [Colias eurytheme]|nr:unnamed protein product [Colias eurytheme]